MPSRTSGADALRSRRTKREERCRSRERAERARRAPAHVRRVDEREHEQQHRGGHRHGACDVERAREPRPTAVRDETKPGEECDERKRCRQEEHPAPADLGQEPAEDEAEREAGRAGRRVDRERLVARGALGERRRDDREPGGRGERRADALHEARRDQERAACRETAECRGNDEDAERDQEHTPPTQQVGRPAAEQQEAAVAEHVGAHDPLQRARRHVEVVSDRGKGDADHRHVKRIEEQRAAEHEERSPGAPRKLVRLWAGCDC